MRGRTTPSASPPCARATSTSPAPPCASASAARAARSTRWPSRTGAWRGWCGPAASCRVTSCSSTSTSPASARRSTPPTSTSTCGTSPARTSPPRISAPGAAPCWPSGRSAPPAPTARPPRKARTARPRPPHPASTASGRPGERSSRPSSASPPSWATGPPSAASTTCTRQSSRRSSTGAWRRTAAACPSSRHGPWPCSAGCRRARRRRPRAEKKGRPGSGSFRSAAGDLGIQPDRSAPISGRCRRRRRWRRRDRSAPHRHLGFDVDLGLGKLGELVVGLFLLLEGLLEHLHGLLGAEDLRVGADGAVGGNLVMLDTLRGGDQPGIDHVGIALRLDHLLAFLDQAFHAVAGLALRPLAERAEQPLQAGDVLAGLAEMLIERILETGVMSRLDHLRQRIDQLSLGVEEVAELFEVEIFQGLHLHVGLLWVSWFPA